MVNLQSSPSSSNTTLKKIYDVFVNFRGEDTRDCFTSHLDEALYRNQIKAFIDYQLRVGDVILPGLMGAINKSKISVVIFSKDYATSKWCLRELVEILKCKEMNDQIVIPVFYRVEPTDVRNQTGSYKDSFVEHEKEFHEEAIKWRQALAEACGIKGWHSSKGRTDATLVKEIVKDILEKLMSEYIPPDFGGLIGLKPRIEQIISLLCLHITTDVRIIGIWGMGGIGKTTLSDAIFNQNKNQFEGVCFIQNVRERLANSGGLVSVQKEILSEVLNDEGIKLDSPTIPPKIKERLNRLKVFIVLDDVDDSLKMETLVKGVDRLGQGSRIIITSRDKQVLRNCCVNDDNICEVKELNCDEALELFCKYCHSKDLMVNRLINFTKGNPLALKVLGSLLKGKSNEELESVVNKFELKDLSRGIFDVLKISYDGLMDIEQDIFLDIACFFKGKELDYVEKILDDCRYSLGVLIDKSLITISFDGKIEMHDLLEEMGRDIVNKKSPNEIGKCSRLWRQQDVLRTLKNDYGTSAVRGIFLDMFEINKDIHLSPRAFKEMYNLRLLKFYDSTRSTRSKVNFSEGLSDLSDELRSLIWYGYPLQALPSNFNPNNLVELDLRDSNLERLWEDWTPAPNLRWLDLSGCTRVTKILDLSKSPLLEWINLKDCSSLLGFPQLCMDVPKLRWLNLSRCTRVTKIPGLSKSPLLEKIDLQDCSSLLDFPQLAQHLKNLRYLNLRGCNSLRSFPSDIHFESLTSLDLSNCNNLTNFPQISGNNITSLDLRGTAIKELHHSISHLNGLQELFLRGCKNLETLPSGIHFQSLRSLDLSNCNNLTNFPQISGNNITRLDLSGTAIKELIHSIAHLNGLKKLFLRRCKNLKILPSSICNSTSLQHLDLLGCSRLEILPENLGNLKSLEYLSAKRAAIKELPHSLAHLNGLEELFLGGCENLEMLPSGICNLTYLRHLDLSDCSRLEMLPKNLGNLKSLKDLIVDRTAISQLPSSMKRLKNLKKLSCCGCRGLRFIHSSGLQSMMELCNLQFLHLDNCNMVLSLIDLPLNLTHLSACDCKQLQSIPNERDFARIRKPAEFIFTNCMNLEETAVGNMLAQLVKYLRRGYSCFRFCYQGSEVPKWFRYTTEGSSIKFQETFDCDLKGFAVCAVIAFEKYHFSGDSQHKLGVHFHCTYNDGDQSSPTKIMSETAYVASKNSTLIDSDHVAFGYCDASYHSWHFGIQSKNYSFEFRLSEESPNCRLKSCGVWPIYYHQEFVTDDSDVSGTCRSRIYEEDSDFEDSDVASTCGSRFYEEELESHPKEYENLQTVKYAEPIEHIGETSRIRRSRTSNDHLEEEVEPHPKRLNI